MFNDGGASVSLMPEAVMVSLKTLGGCQIPDLPPRHCVTYNTILADNLFSFITPL